MHKYYNRKPNDRRNKRLRHEYRRYPGRPIDSWQQHATPIRTIVPPPSSSEISYAAGYAPDHPKESTTSPPLRRKVMNTDPELSGVAARQSHLPRAVKMDTQKLPPGKNDEPSLSGQLKCFAIEIERSFKRMRPEPRIVSVVILICLLLLLHLWLLLLQMLWQALASWLNPIYLISGIIASTIVIYEFVKRSLKRNS